MTYFRTVVASVFIATSIAGQASAQQVEPIHSQIIDLGTVNGDVYYTVQPNGFHVVATFAERGEAGQPVRFETVLAPGQSVTISTPRGVDVPSEAVSISRQADRVLVRRGALVD
jgi:hypothetical protein